MTTVDYLSEADNVYRTKNILFVKRYLYVVVAKVIPY